MAYLAYRTRYRPVPLHQLFGVLLGHLGVGHRHRGRGREFVDLLRDRSGNGFGFRAGVEREYHQETVHRHEKEIAESGPEVEPISEGHSEEDVQNGYEDAGERSATEGRT